VVRPDGTLDRAALRHRILSDADAKRRLEAIVHPAVEARRRELLTEAAARGASLVIVEIPLLFESADPSAYDGMIVVDAPESERRRRLIEERGLTPDDAARLLAAQWPAAAKRERATWVIDNDGERDTLAQRAHAVWDALHA
jgi:dephospho-CoA kinase